VIVHHENTTDDRSVLAVTVRPLSRRQHDDNGCVARWLLRYRCPRCHQWRYQQLDDVRLVEMAQRAVREKALPWVAARYTAGGEFPPAAGLHLGPLTPGDVVDLGAALADVDMDDVWWELAPRPTPPEIKFNQQEEGQE
jgi:hypothetical protein